MSYSQNCGDLYIGGVLDGSLGGGVPKLIQVCANADIADLSVYGIGTANNGGGSSGVEYTFPAMGLVMGSCFNIASENSGYVSFFGCAPDAIDNVALINGNDAVELFCNGSLIDVYGDPNVNGNGQPWDYEDGWAASLDNLPSVVFQISDWNVSGVDALDGATTNSTAVNPYPNDPCATPITNPPANSNVLSELSIMTYNLLNFPNPGNTNSIGEDAARVIYFRSIVDVEDPDIIVLQELTDFSGMSMLVNELNTNGTLGYTYGHASSYTGYGGLGNGMIYKMNNLVFTAQQELAITNSGTSPNGNTQFAPRAGTVYSFEASTASCTDIISFEIVSTHLKAGNNNPNGSQMSDRDRRDLGILDVLDYTNLQANTANIIVAGDFNFRADNVNSGNDSEPGYVNLIEVANSVDFIDPLGGFVRDQSAYAHTYTQSTRGNISNEYGNGGAPGGLDDRFDFIFLSESIQNNSNQITYVPNSYQVKGSPMVLGDEACDSNATNCTDFAYMSDHYPVKVDISLEFTSCGSPCPVDTLLSVDFILNEVELIQASNAIEANNLIGVGADIHYRAGNEIILESGFEVELNSVFLAEIVGCQ